MTWMGAWLFNMPLVYRLLIYAALVGGAWGGLAYWKHTIYKSGYAAGENSVKAEWAKATQKEIDNGQKIRTDAVRDVDRAGDDGMRDDPRNRDNVKEKP